MDEALILDEDYYKEAMTYFLTKDIYDEVIDELDDYFNKCNNKYLKKSKASKIRYNLFQLNRPERKKKSTCPYCKKEMLNVNYKKHFKSQKHIKKYGNITD